LGFWELAAAVRPMVDPDEWKVTETDGLDKNIFQQSMAEARKRV